MQKIPNAKISPRVECGAIFWYEGDTCEIEFHFNIFDEQGQPMEITDSGAITISIRDIRKKTIYEASFSNIQSNAVMISIDEEVTKKFPKGRYYYDIVFDDNYVTTMVAQNKIIVE